MRLVTAGRPFAPPPFPFLRWSIIGGACVIGGMLWKSRHARRLSSAFLVTIAVASGLAAPTAAADDVLIFAAASLTNDRRHEAAHSERYRRRPFEPRTPRVLAKQIEAGAPADLFIPPTPSG